MGPHGGDHWTNDIADGILNDDGDDGVHRLDDELTDEQELIEELGNNDPDGLTDDDERELGEFTDVEDTELEPPQEGEWSELEDDNV